MNNSTKNENSRKFDLGTVLTITTGKLLTDISNVYDALAYLTQNEIIEKGVYTSAQGIATSMGLAKDRILARYPQLRDATKTLLFHEIEDQATARAFLENQKQVYGNDFILEPMIGFGDNIDEDNRLMPDPLERFRNNQYGARRM